MAIRGIELDRTNPSFLRRDFSFWMPQFENFINTTEGLTYFNKLRDVANQRIYKSIFGADWEQAMSLCIAHYLFLIGKRKQMPTGSTLEEALNAGTYQGLLVGASVGGFNKQLDFDKTMVASEESKFWNLSPYGADLMALYKTKAVPSIFVVTREG